MPSSPEVSSDPVAAYLRARAVSETFKAKTAQLEYEERAGKLIQASLTCSHCSREWRSDRNGFCQLGLENEQNRSLLQHEDPEYLINKRYGDFVFGEDLRELRAAVHACGQGALCDIGCGGGWYSVGFSGLYRHYFGLEPSTLPEWETTLGEIPANVTLVHYRASGLLPIVANSVDMIAFIGSYDHIPNRFDVLGDAWSKLKRGGHLLIYMTNYGFWLKRLISWVSGQPVFRHEGDHYCTHSPSSLTDEVLRTLPDARLFRVSGDIVMIPNGPRWLSVVYPTTRVVKMLNSFFKTIIVGVLRVKACGSGMIVVFEKSDERPLG